MSGDLLGALTAETNVLEILYSITEAAAHVIYQKALNSSASKLAARSALAEVLRLTHWARYACACVMIAVFRMSGTKH